MTSSTPRRWITVLGLILPAIPARAQDGGFELGAPPAMPMPPPLTTSFIEAGIGALDATAFHLGRYGGPAKRGAFPIVRAHVQGGDGWDAGARTWRGTLDVFGVDAVSGTFRGGVQGQWRANLTVDNFTTFITHTAGTPFNGAGTADLTLPSTWTSSNTSAQFTSLAQTLQPLDLKIAWRSVGGDVMLTPRAGYEIRFSASHRAREGLRGQSLAFGHEMNTAVGVFFPQPVDYDTNQASASLAFTGAAVQWAASYTLSVFTNDLTAVRVPNPYNRALGGLWPGGALAAFPNAVGAYGLPPSSAAHQALVSGAYVFSPKVRVTARLSYMVQTQDEDFLAYTATSGLNTPEALPRDSLDGKVHKTNVALGVTLRPAAAVDISANYVFDDRDNRSPMNVYSYVANEAQDQPRPLTPGASRYIRINLPHSFTFHQARADVGVRIAARSRLTFSYTGDFRARTYQQVSDTSEHSFRIKALTTFAAGSAWGAYTYATRRGSAYEDALPWDLSHTQSYLDASPFSRSIEHPLLRKYNMADRTRHEMKGGATWDFGSSLSLDATAFLAEDDYTNSALGLQRSETIQMDTSATYAAGKRLTANAFYSFERIKSDLTGYLMGTVNLSNPAQNWSAANRDIVHTVGAKADWTVLPDKLKLTAGYTLSDGTSRMGAMGTGFALIMTTAPLPDLRDVTHTVSLAGDYTLKAGVTLRAGYALTRHRTADWALGWSAAPVAQLLGSGMTAPRYMAHMGWVTARYAY